MPDDTNNNTPPNDTGSQNNPATQSQSDAGVQRNTSPIQPRTAPSYTAVQPRVVESNQEPSSTPPVPPTSEAMPPVDAASESDMNEASAALSRDVNEAIADVESKMGATPVSGDVAGVTETTPSPIAENTATTASQSSPNESSSSSTTVAAGAAATGAAVGVASAQQSNSMQQNMQSMKAVDGIQAPSSSASASVIGSGVVDSSDKKAPLSTMSTHHNNNNYSPNSQPGAPKKKKKWLPLAIVGVVVALLLGGGLSAYAFWYQNPERVVDETITKAISASSGRYKLAVKDIKMSATPMSSAFALKSIDIETGMNDNFTGEAKAKVNMELSGKEVAVGGAVRFADKDTVYFKIDSMESALETLKKDLAFSNVVSMYGEENIKSVISTLSKDWVKVDLNKLADGSDETMKAYKCMLAVYSNKDAVKAYSDKQIDAYKANKFMVYKETLESKDGNQGYLLTVDKEKAKAYEKEINDTDFSKSINECTKEIEGSQSTTSETSVFDMAKFERVEIWVSQFGHDLKKMNLKMSVDQEKSAQSISMVIDMDEIDLNKQVKVETPESSIEIKEWMQNVEKAVADVMKGMSRIQSSRGAVAPINTNGSYTDQQVVY